MRFVFLSRQKNRSGYFILEYLLRHSEHKPECVILPPHEGRRTYLQPPRATDRSATVDGTRVEHAANEHGFTASIDQLADEHGVPVHHVGNINSGDGLRLLQSYAPELIVIGGGWPQLLKHSVISLPPLGVINTHPSLLPEFRGTDVHRWQVLQGVRSSGSSIHYVDEDFDTGGILGQSRIDVSPADTPQELATKAALVAGPLMAEVLASIEAVAPRRVAGPGQGHPGGERYFSRWRWDDPDFLRLDWTKPAMFLQRFVLASTQESYLYNGPHFRFRDRRYILRRATLARIESALVPGSIVALDGDGPVVACGTGALVLTELQPASERFWPDMLQTEAATDGHGFCIATGARETDRLD